jgi:putative polyhydroxyalkanoate system protein
VYSRRSRGASRGENPKEKSMADISITKSHNVELGVLRGRLEELAKDLKAKYGVRSRWEGDTCLLDGAGLKQGVVKVTSSSLSLELTLGMMAKLLKPKIEEEIGKKIGKILSA